MAIYLNDLRINHPYKSLILQVVQTLVAIIPTHQRSRWTYKYDNVVRGQLSQDVTAWKANSGYTLEDNKYVTLISYLYLGESPSSYLKGSFEAIGYLPISKSISQSCRCC